MNNIKLTEYLLGHLSPENDAELKSMLKSEGIGEKLSKLSKQLENIATTIPSVKPSKKLKQSIFDHIEKSGNQQFSGLIVRLTKFFQLPIKRINEVLDACKDINTSKWDKARIEGAYLYHFAAGGDLQTEHCGLIYLKSGTTITNHEHLGEERMFVLQGEVTTNNGKTYTVGDTAISHKGSSHTLVSGMKSDCIFAVIAIGGVKFDNE